MLNVKTPLILIVDDDRTMRSLLNLAMEEEGYRVVEAADGEQCLSEYTHFQPDLILLDAVMPDINGFACCQKIRSLPKGDRLPILMITVLDDRDSVEKAFQAGATDYITKPIHWSVLSHRVRSLLTQRQAWTKLAAVEAQLDRQQGWSQLISKILEQIVSGNRSNKLIEILNLIRQRSPSIRVCLSRADYPVCLESVADGYPPIAEVFSPEFNFAAEYGELYQQGQTIVIENVSRSDLLPETKERLKQLKTESLWIVPIQRKRILGWLQIHFSQSFPDERLSPNQLKDLANLLTIAVE